MKVTTIAEAVRLAREVDTADCVLTGKYHQQVPKLYRQIHGLSKKQMNGYEVHHLCESRYRCLNIDHLCLMTKSDHKSLHKSGENHHLFGKSHTDEAKQKMLQKVAGKNHPCFGKPRSEETKRKVSEARMGMIFSDEHKAKLSLSTRIYWARKRGDHALADKLQAERDALE